MRVTWIIPEPYGFLVDELQALSGRLAGIRVLCSTPIPIAIRDRLPRVAFHECPESAFIPLLASCGPFRSLVRSRGWLGILRNGWHVRKIAGIYKTLNRLEEADPSSLIHSHFAHPAGLGGSLLGNVPQLVTLRGYDILTTGSYGSLWNPFYRRNLIDAFAEGGVVTTGSSHSLQRARQILGPNADLKFLPEAIVTDSFVPSGVHTRESLGLAPDAVVLLTVGNLVPVKNHQMLLDSLKDVLPRCRRPLHLLVCGDGPLESVLSQQAMALGIADRVHFMGRLPRGELSDLYALGDVLVHTSLSEGFGSIILEAMLKRLLVVASPVGIAPDLIQHRENGFLPALGDRRSLVDSLSEAIGRLPLFGAALDANRDVVLAGFDMDRRIDGYMALYEEAAQRQNARP
jgi:glycosyltransferase involved in cell wall biosynthesis